MRTSRLRARDIVRVLSVGYGGAFLPGDRDDLAVVCPPDHVPRECVPFVARLRDELERPVIVSPVSAALVVKAHDLSLQRPDMSVVVRRDVILEECYAGVLRQQVNGGLLLVSCVVWAEVCLPRVGGGVAAVAHAVRRVGRSCQ